MSIHNGWRYTPPPPQQPGGGTPVSGGGSAAQPQAGGASPGGAALPGHHRPGGVEAGKAEGGRGEAGKRKTICVEMSPCFSIGILHSSQWRLVVNGRCYSMYILSLLQRMALDRFLQRCIAVYSKLHQLQLLVGRMFLALGKMDDSTYLHLPPSPFLNTASELRSVRANRAARPRQGGGQGSVGVAYSLPL